MLPDNIDDLFRNQLDGHETTPGPDLWTRLQAQPAAETPRPERLDQLFQQRLSAHATPPARELWERLEDEHLRPRKRRAAAWWPLAMAAAVALLIVAGGARLWLGFPSGSTPSGTVASHQGKGKGNRPTVNSKATGIASTSSESTVSTKETQAAAASHAAATRTEIASNNPTKLQEMTFSGTTEKNATAQATRPASLASTASKARMAATGQSPRHPLGTSRTPDATSKAAPLVARTTAHPATRPALDPRPSTAADEPRPATKPETLVATIPKPAPAPEIVPAHAVLTPSVASADELITVDVRNGSTAARPARSISTALAVAEEPEERRGLGGRLLKQAGHLVRGERVSLAEATGLPENVTLRATIAGHSVSKSIQL